MKFKLKTNNFRMPNAKSSQIKVAYAFIPSSSGMNAVVVKVLAIKMEWMLMKRRVKVRQKEWNTLCDWELIDFYFCSDKLKNN